VAVLTTASFGSLAFLSVSAQAIQVLIWLINMSAVAGLIGWIALCVANLRLHAAMAAQGYSRKDLPYRSPHQPYSAWFALIACILVILLSGFTVFLKNNFSVSGFLSYYANVFVFLALYVFWKIYKRSRVFFIPATEIDLSEFEIIRAEIIEEATSGDIRITATAIDSRNKKQRWLRRVIDRVF